MHVPDGFIDAGTSLAAGALATGGLAVASRQARDTVDDRRIPLAGVVAAFVFAVQMRSFPGAGGTSGHVLGGVLAAVLVGPWVGSLCLAVVLIVQTLFADGGLSALGINLVNVALVPTLLGYLLFMTIRTVAPRTRTGLLAAATVAAGMSVVMSAGAFVVEFSIGGSTALPLATVAAAMLPVHALIGIGEAVLTASALGLVLGVRPDLVHGAAKLDAAALASPRRKAWSR